MPEQNQALTQHRELSARRTTKTSTICGAFSVAALLLATFGCGGPGSGRALFDSSGGSALGTGGTVNQSSGGSGDPGSGVGSGASTGGSASTEGGANQGGAASGSGMGGEANGGAASGGGLSGAGGGSAGTGFGGHGHGGSGGVLSDCSAFGPNAAFDPDTKHCYLLVPDLVTFAEASAHCTSLGAHLVTISDQQENEFVWKLDMTEHWIGASDGKAPKEMGVGTYTWVDGEPFSYTNWTPGQPNAVESDCDAANGGGPCYEHCAFQWSGGQWNDQLCLHMVAAVCEWDG
jgi:hypothetical protein